MRHTLILALLLFLGWACSGTDEAKTYQGNTLVNKDGVSSIENVDNTQTWSTYLRRLPGVIVRGQGQNLVIRIRSTNNSFLMDSSPLFVVDNMAVGNDFQSLAGSINLGDVESITVLKNANETSMWGLRGANGVIVVRSKKGGSNN